MKKTVAGELLEEMLGTSIRSFLTAQNRIPQTYRDQETTLGSQILLWLWLRNRFNELEKKLEQEIKALKPKVTPEWKIDDK